MAKAKVMLTLGYRTYVLDAASAVQVLELLDTAEIYEMKWRSGEDSTYHVYAQDKGDAVTMQMLPQSLYLMYKLSGRPETS